MLEVPEYYQPYLPNYFRQARSTGQAMVNGRFVSDEEYNELTGEAVDRPNFVPHPIYISEELNMCHASCTPAMVIDMVDNMVPFKFINIEDALTIADIIDGYVAEVSPYESANRDLQNYNTRARTASNKLRVAYEEITRDMALNAGRKPYKPQTLIEILKGMV